MCGEWRGSDPGAVRLDLLGPPLPRTNSKTAPPTRATLDNSRLGSTVRSPRSSPWAESRAVPALRPHAASLSARFLASQSVLLLPVWPRDPPTGSERNLLFLLRRRDDRARSRGHRPPDVRSGRTPGRQTPAPDLRVPATLSATVLFSSLPFGRIVQNFPPLAVSDRQRQSPSLMTHTVRLRHHPIESKTRGE